MSENQSSAKKASEPRTAPVPRVESAQAEATVTGGYCSERYREDCRC